MQAMQGQSKRFEEQVEPDVTLTMTDLNKFFLSGHGTLPRAAVFAMNSVSGLSFLLQVSLQMSHSFAQLFILVLERRDAISSDFVEGPRPRRT